MRRSPFYEATVAEGVKAFSTYNHMLMPTSYGDPEAEYWRLLDGVAMWDVAVGARAAASSATDLARGSRHSPAPVGRPERNQCWKCCVPTSPVA